MSLAVILALTLTARAQVLDTKVPLTGWRVIETEHFRILYPAFLEDKAQETASTMEHIREPVTRGLGEHPRKIHLVLESDSAMPNGYVQLAPRRSGYFLVPPSSTSAAFGLGTTTSWLDALAVHEYRHVTQFAHGFRGLVWPEYVVGGEMGWALGTFLSSPMWWFEGDAVTTETVLTSGGRGRNPGFDLMTRALLLEQGPLTYNRAYLGSYQDPYANVYTLGYLLVTYGRRTWGPDLWPQVSARAAAWNLAPWPFGWSLKRETGLTLPRFYLQAMEDLQSRWQAQLAGLAFTESVAFAPLAPSPSWENDVSPKPLPDGSIVVYRAGIDDPGSLVRLWPDGRQERLLQVPLRMEEGLSVHGWQVAWAEVGFSPRWASRSFSVVRILDVQTGETRQITHRTRIFAPAFSPDGTRLAAVSVGADARSSLLVMDAATGEGLARFPTPDGQLWHTPVWLPDGRRVALLVRDDKEGLAPAVLDTPTGRLRLLRDFAHVNLSQISVAGDHLFLVSHASGIENVWALHLESGEMWQVTSRPLAAYTPSVTPDGKSLLFSDYAWRGARVHTMTLDPTRWVPQAAVEDRSLRYFEPLVAQEGAGDVVAQVPSQTWESRPYHRALHMLRPHSWTPQASLSEATRQVGLSVTSEDITSTTAITASWDYSFAEQVHGGQVLLSYQGLWPILDLGAQADARSVYLTEPDVSDEEEPQEGRVTWNEQGLDLGLRLPLQLSHGAWYRSASLGASVGLTRFQDLESTAPFAWAGEDQGWFPQEEGLVRAASLDASYRQAQPSSSRALGPRWGVGLDLGIRRTLPGSDWSGAWTGASATLSLPGLTPLHSTTLYLSAEAQDPTGYTFSGHRSTPRGYVYTAHEQAARVSLGYDLPLLNVDRGLGPLLFVYRLRGGAFYDHGWGITGDTPTTYPSVGGHLAVDTSLMRLPAPLGLGAQVAWRLDGSGWEVTPAMANIPF